MKFQLILFLFQFNLLKLVSTGEISLKLSPIRWHWSNKHFKNDNYYKIEGHFGQGIDIVCPKSKQYSRIYRITNKSDFEQCFVNTTNESTIPVFECKPNSVTKVFTFYFLKLSPVPNALEFKESMEYFFLSTSTGDYNGLSNERGGLCRKFNMKLSIRIVDKEKPQVNNKIEYQYLKSEASQSLRILLFYGFKFSIFVSIFNFYQVYL
jgi:hypothetical protein